MIKLILATLLIFSLSSCSHLCKKDKCGDKKQCELAKEKCHKGAKHDCKKEKCKEGQCKLGEKKGHCCKKEKCKKGQCKLKK